MRKQLLGNLAMAFRARELIDGLAIPVEFEPAQAIENGEDRAFGGARLVGILDPQQHLAAGVLGIQPVEQRRTRTADMQVARGRWRKTRDDLFAHAIGEFLE